jgi:hypothetical protein
VLYMAANPRSDQITKLRDTWEPAITAVLGGGGGRRGQQQQQAKVVSWRDVEGAVRVCTHETAAGTLTPGMWHGMHERTQQIRSQAASQW